jgi:release factor glutamine methyltransferase
VLLRAVSSALEASSVVESPIAEARWIVEKAAGRPHAELLGFDPELPRDVVERAEGFVRRRLEGEPLQYIVGVAGFRTIDLEVGPGVFIPRPETEVVAGRALELLPQGGTLVDVGTGSGAIALATASERPDARVYATERSKEALSWAERNARRLDLPVTVFHCDHLEGLPLKIEGRVDVVVSNPPYVARSEQQRLPVDVVEHEPHEALFSSAEGLSDVRRIARDAVRWLAPEGWLVMEIGETQGGAALEILNEIRYRSASVDVDLIGRDRVVLGRRP